MPMENLIDSGTSPNDDSNADPPFVPREPRSADLSRALIVALADGDIQSVRECLQQGVNFGTQYVSDRGTSTALHLAAGQQNPNFLMELLAHDEKPPFMANRDGETPLHVASRCSQSISPLLLLISNYGVSPASNRGRNTFLHVLMSNQSISPHELTELVSWLFTLDGTRAIMNHTNDRNETMYDIAGQSHAGNTPMLKLLLREGACSGARLQDDRIVALTAQEEAHRQAIEGGEVRKRTTERDDFDTAMAVLRRFHRKLANICEKEARRRTELEERERISYTGTHVKRSAHYIRVLERQRRHALKAATYLFQRVGRGFFARLHMTVCRHQSALAALIKVEVAAAVTGGVHTDENHQECSAVLLQDRRDSSDHLVGAATFASDVQDNRTAAANIIGRAYQSHTFRRRIKAMLTAAVELRRAQYDGAVVIVQAYVRGFVTRRRLRILIEATTVIQRRWRQQTRILKRKRQAATIVARELSRLYSTQQRWYFINTGSTLVHEARVRGITRAVTQLVWRENFCSAFRDIIFLQRRKEPPQPPCVSRFRRWQHIARTWEQYVLLAQFIISLFLLIYMACVPRTSVSNKHGNVDISFCCVELVIVMLLPVERWRIVDVAVTLSALVCAAARAHGGSLVIALLTLKFPFVVRSFAPEHSGTRTYCRMLEHSLLYLALFAPLALAGVGAAVRGTTANRLLVTANGNWGSVFLHLWSTLSPQYTYVTVYPKGQRPHCDETNMLCSVEGRVQIFPVGDDNEVTLVQMPLVQLIVFHIVLLAYTWSAILVGTHGAYRSHYDISDGTKLKKNKHRFRNAGKMELLEAHRAANIEALGQKVDGVMWEADVRAAKEAIDASHYDHNTNGTVQRFVRRVQDSVAQGNVMYESPRRYRPERTATGASVSVEQRKWDCRNEDTQSRGIYDVEVIEGALGMATRKSRAERFFERQWTGQIYKRESTIVLILMLVMASVRPNLFAMEAIFASVLVVELLLSLYFLRFEFILSHYVRFIVRIFCVVVGFIPSAIPFVAFRCLRLFEGWSTVYVLPGMVRWGIMYGVISFVTLWMIAFAAALQFLHGEAHKRRSDPTLEAVALCQDAAQCLAVSLRELVLPAWTPEHIDATREAPLMATLVIASQLFFIPFFLSIALHPLLQLSNFIGRFLRLVIQSLHKDVLDYLDNYLEGASWYRRWELKTQIPVNVIAKLKMWVYDLHRRKGMRVKPLQRDGFDSLGEESYFFSQATFIVPCELQGDKNEAEDQHLTEIISRKEFSSFSENERADAVNGWRHPKILLTNSARNPLLHFANAILALASIAFLWVPDPASKCTDALLIVAAVLHLCSTVTAVLVIPRDLTAVLTIISNCSLIVAVVFSLLPNRSYMAYYSIRFISLVRLTQIQIPPFQRIRRSVKTYIEAGSKIIFPIIVVGALAYVAELLRAQIYMVRHRTFAESNSTWSTNESSWGASTNLTYEEELARVPRKHKSRPNVLETSNLFSYYFTQDAYIYFSIFNYWLLPALCISTCLAYLYWSGANLRDTNRLLVNYIPLLEDPITVAGFLSHKSYYRSAANVVLAISLVFGCIFSPSTDVTSSGDHKLFFGLEIAFTVCGLLEAILSTAFAIHRCGRSLAAYEAARAEKTFFSILLGDCTLVAAEVVELLYYAIALPLCITLLLDGDHCIISPSNYATIFITLRFVLLLRLLPRQHILAFIKDSALFFVAVAAIVIYLVGAASALADTTAVSKEARTPHLWRMAFDAILRQTFTSAVPANFVALWRPLNDTDMVRTMMEAGVTSVTMGSDYTSSRLLFILSMIGRAFIASAIGLAVAVWFLPLRTQLQRPLPPKSALLYKTLCGGCSAILNIGSATHDDMRPEVRRKVQGRKFSRVFTSTGIPSWALPHLLEELNICRPAHQRRFMFALEWLLVYLPISEHRQASVEEYMDLWECYRSGGAAKLNFSTLPVFPPDATERASNPLAPSAVSSAEGQRYIHPLRLVQALALFELGFPAESSVGSKLWLDFFTVVQKMRGATLLQSLWRTYCEEKKFDKERPFSERKAIAALRRSFRKIRIRNDAAFRTCSSFKEAVSFERDVFNPDTGHFDLLSRLSGHYSQLEPADDFVICTNVTAGSANHVDTVSAYRASIANSRSSSVQGDIISSGLHTPSIGGIRVPIQ